MSETRQSIGVTLSKDRLLSVVCLDIRAYVCMNSHIRVHVCGQRYISSDRSTLMYRRVSLTCAYAFPMSVLTTSLLCSRISSVSVTRNWAISSCRIRHFCPFITELPHVRIIYATQKNVSTGT